MAPSVSGAVSDDASVVAALIAVDPVGLGGTIVRADGGWAQERWLSLLASLMPAAAPSRRVPLHVDEDRLLGGIDLPATLQSGRTVGQQGLLADADGGILVLAMAERVTPAVAAHITSALDLREVLLERHGMGARQACRIGVVALDEGVEGDEQVPASLRDRLAFEIRLPVVALPSANSSMSPAEDVRRLLAPPDSDSISNSNSNSNCNCKPTASDAPERSARPAVEEARALLVRVDLSDQIIEALGEATLALGVASPRALLFAARAARALAALDGRVVATSSDAARAAALVFAHRATRVPTDAAPPQESAEASPPPAPPDQTPDPAPADESDNDAPDEPGDDTDDTDDSSLPAEASLDDVVLAAAMSSIPEGLLARIAPGSASAVRSSSGGRVGAIRKSPNRGRPIGSRRGDPRAGARLNLLETLRAAAPWQGLRQREAESRVGAAPAPDTADAHGTSRIHVRRDDFRVWRFKQRSETTTIFVVDASGSAALHRLAETKGAVELLLADCYVRRDSVAVIAFRGAAAELLLPPTRSLVRAKRSLAGLPGGGGTPLASGLDAACALAESVRHRGSTPMVVLLTDGRGNIARDGSPGRARAGEDALAAARHMRVEGIASLLLDTSPHAQDQAARLAEAMGAHYLLMPYAGAQAMSEAVRNAGVASSPSLPSPRPKQRPDHV